MNCRILGAKAQEVLLGVPLSGGGVLADRFEVGFGVAAFPGEGADAGVEDALVVPAAEGAGVDPQQPRRF